MSKKFDRYFYSTFFRLLSVVALQSLIVFGVNLADSVMLGKYSELAMSGVSLANQVQFFLQSAMNGVANGLVVIASQYWGKMDINPIKRLFSSALWISVGISSTLAIIVFITPSGVLGLFSGDKAIVDAGVEYIRIMLHSYVIFAVTQVLIAVMRSVETVSIGFQTALLALVVNIALNYLLIFGKLGFPELGAVGAAYATLISRIAELLLALYYVLFRDKKIKLRIRDAFILRKNYFIDYVKAGLPLVGSGSSWGVAMGIQAAIIGRLGAAAIGANAIAAPVFQVASVVYQASSSASAVLIGKTVGEGSIDRVKLYSKRLQKIYLIIGLASFTLMMLIRGVIVDFYNVSPETRETAMTFLAVLAVTIIGSAYEAPCLCGIMPGGGETKFVLINDIVFMWFMVLPLSALSAFVFKWPVGVTFFILKSDQITKCFVAIYKVNKYKWIHKLTRDREQV